MADDALAIFMRYLHIVSAVVAVGGIVFVLVCLMPVTRLLDDTFRQSLMRMVHHRFVRMIWAAILGLVVSGVYNYIRLLPVYDAIRWGGVKIAHMLMGIKILFSLVIFTLVFLRSVGLIRPEQQRAMLITNLSLALLVILLGTLLRQLRLEQMVLVTGP